MEELKKKSAVEMNDKEIVFSKSIKAGKRIYYLDVKKNRKDEMFLAITESKKIISGEGEEAQVSFEKHKIFLYKEDFEKFLAGVRQAIEFINDKQSVAATKTNLEVAPKEVENKENTDTSERSTEALNEEIKIDIDF